MGCDSQLNRETHFRARFPVGIASRQGRPSARLRVGGPSPYDAVLARKIRSIQSARADRARFFDVELFGEPAWDILLDLFAISLEQRRVSITGLCNASGVPLTTALRWIASLEERAHIVRREDPLDARRTFIMLSERGLSAMREYFDSLPLDVVLVEISS